jgi:hypothetical protein
MLKMKTKISDIESICEQMARIYENCVIEAFIEWAKEDDMYLRSNDGFNDHTGNLRSSLGAAVFNDARLVFSTPFATVLKGSQGSSEGRKAVDSLAERTRGRIAKVMVAGMGYAQKVEDIDYKDVLESRRIQCEREASSVLERAARKAEQMFRKL